ncbi:MAG: hypothetical protein EP340_07830 [Alphaproteobacteria bacterium]|nr:MAG: hypothetical protein EP340_07830 [Alphaproteobacteria bacterium]
MLKFSKALAVSIVGLAAAATPALAEETIPGEFSANLSLTTNYLYRGVTQTSDGAAIQGGFDYSYDAFYAGVWASSLDFGDASSTGIEMDWYAGYAPTINGIDLDFGVLYYTYPDSIDDGAEQDFVELYAGLGGALTETFSLSGKISYSPDFYLETGDAWYYQLDAGLTLTEALSASAHYGYQTFDDSLLDEYADWNIGLTYSIDWVDLDFRYYDTQDRIGGSNDDVFVFAISRSF